MVRLVYIPPTERMCGSMYACVCVRVCCITYMLKQVCIPVL